MDFLVNKELLEKLLQYLSTKPFAEVSFFINELAKSKPNSKEEVKQETKQEETK